MPASSSTQLMHACLGQDLRIHGRRSGRTQVVRLDVLPTVCKFTGLTALWLESSDLFLLTPGSITALAPLHQLSSLHTSLWAAPSEQPMDLAEYALLPGAQTMRSMQGSSLHSLLRHVMKHDIMKRIAPLEWKWM